MAVNLQSVLEEMAKQLEGFLSIAVVDPDGLPVAGTSKANADMSIPAGMFAQAKREVDKAFEVSEWGNVNEYLFNSNETRVVLTTLPQGHYLGVATESSASLGMARALTKKYLPKIKEALAG